MCKVAIFQIIGPDVEALICCQHEIVPCIWSGGVFVTEYLPTYSINHIHRQLGIDMKYRCLHMTKISMNAHSRKLSEIVKKDKPAAPPVFRGGGCVHMLTCV